MSRSPGGDAERAAESGANAGCTRTKRPPWWWYASWCGVEEKMMSENNAVYTVDELKTMLLPVFEGYNIRRAVLFGSYSKGQATAKSDVDILVDSGLRGLRFVGFMDDVKRRLNGKEVDLFDVSHVNHGSMVEKEIRNTGVEIYAK